MKKGERGIWVFPHPYRNDNACIFLTKTKKEYKLGAKIYARFDGYIDGVDRGQESFLGYYGREATTQEINHTSRTKTKDLVRHINNWHTLYKFLMQHEAKIKMPDTFTPEPFYY